MLRGRGIVAGWLLVTGGAAVVAGALVEGYAQSVLLEFGAAVVLFAPLVLAEGLLTGRIGRKVRDGVVGTLNRTGVQAAPESPAAVRDLRDALLAALPPGWLAERRSVAPFDLVVERAGRRIAIAVRRTPFPLDWVTVRRLHIQARQAGHAGLVLCTLTPPTDLAAELAQNSPGLVLLSADDPAAELARLLSTRS